VLQAVRGADSTDRRAPAKAALLALLLLAGAGRAQDAGKDDDVLGWLSGGSLPAQAAPAANPQANPPADAKPAPPPAQADPTPKAPPPASDGDVLDWLAGGSPAPDAAGTASAGAPQAPRAVSGSGKPSPAAQAFAEQLKAAMTLEVQAQELENSTLGAEAHPETLQGFKKQRYDRIQKDKAEFRQRAGQMSLQGLDMPKPAEGVQLSRDAVTLLAALQRGYESTRTTRPLEQYTELNNAFIKLGDMTQRDRAVQMRDEIVDREVAFTRLLQDAATVAGGGGGDELISSMTDTLNRVAPDAHVGSDDLAVLVLKDKGLRDQVMAEVTSILTTRPPPAAQPAPDAELRPKVAKLQAKLIELGQLKPVIQEHGKVAGQVKELDEQLATDLPINRKKDLVAKRTTALARGAELEQQWYSTQPDPETFAALTGAQDELIRRRLLDLGPAGVLYGQRADAVHAKLEAGFPDSSSSWHFVQQQQDLVTTLDGVNPTENPLLGITLPDALGAQLMADAQLKVAQEAKLMAQSAPKPQAHKAGGGGPKAPPPKQPQKKMAHHGYHPHPHAPPPKKKKK
jgi:hypothetical protein